MGDYATYLVPERCRVDAPEREKMAQRMVGWLQEKGWIEREKSDCVLSGDGNGWRFTPEGMRYIADAEDVGRITCGFGVETYEEKGVFCNYEGGVESACCPICAEDIGEGFFEVVAGWNTGEDWTRAVCPACGEAAAITDWQVEPAWGFSQVGFAFWGLNAELTEDFVDEFAAELGEPVRVVEVAV